MRPAMKHRIVTGRATYQAQIARRNERFARHLVHENRRVELALEGLPNRATRRIGIERKKEGAA